MIVSGKVFTKKPTKSLFSIDFVFRYYYSAYNISSLTPVSLKIYTNDINPAMNDIFSIIKMTFVTRPQFYSFSRFINSIDLNSIG